MITKVFGKKIYKIWSPSSWLEAEHGTDFRLNIYKNKPFGGNYRLNIFIWDRLLFKFFLKGKSDDESENHCL